MAQGASAQPRVMGGGHPSPDIVHVHLGLRFGLALSMVPLLSLYFYPEHTQEQRGAHRQGEWDPMSTPMYWMAAAEASRQERIAWLHGWKLTSKAGGIRPGARLPGPSVRDVGDSSGALVAQDPGDSGEKLHTSNYRCKTWVLSRFDVLPPTLESHLCLHKSGRGLQQGQGAGLWVSSFFAGKAAR